MIFKQITTTDHFGFHIAYLDVYAEKFKPLKKLGKPVLEIGTDGGGGLLMYADYFKQSHMVGFDPYNQPESVKNIDQISHFMVDAYTDEAIVIAKTFGEFGVIIDDGPHCVGSQSWFVKNYPQLLSADGVAIVEDIPDDERLNILISCVPEGFNYEVRDLRLINGRYDDLLLIITKK